MKEINQGKHNNSVHGNFNQMYLGMSLNKGVKVVIETLNIEF